jgi:hypothetical protein
MLSLSRDEAAVLNIQTKIGSEWKSGIEVWPTFALSYREDQPNRKEGHDK